MSGVVLALGALLALAGVYEMVTGSGDILSERGWSAFIAGAVFVAGGMTTIGLGLAVRAVDRLRSALTGSPLPAIALPAGRDRIEPETTAGEMAPMDATPAAANPRAETIDLARPHVATEPAIAIVPAAAFVAADAVEERRRDMVAPTPALATAHSDGTEEPSMAGGDWLDQSFRDLEREMVIEPESPPTQPPTPPHEFVNDETLHVAPARAPSSHVEPDSTDLGHADLGHADVGHDEAGYEGRHDAFDGATLLDERPVEHAPREIADPLHESESPHPASDGHATVAAREDSAKTDSPVIGRYESEGTSYVMYADGSIDAQSEAGVYRFASMAELKAFIEG